MFGKQMEKRIRQGPRKRESERFHLTAMALVCSLMVNMNNWDDDGPPIGGRAPEGIPCCSLGDGCDQDGGSRRETLQQRCCGKGTCIAVRASGGRKQRTGVNDTGYGEDSMCGNDSGKANATVRGTQ
jgi:hypothetical protein